MAEQTIHNTPGVDLEQFKTGALTRRQLAWNALKETRNPAYVALRYEYTLEQMETALATIPDEQPLYRQLNGTTAHHSANNVHSDKRASELLPEIKNRTREPGEDDDIGEA